MNTQRSSSSKKLTIQKTFNKGSSHLLHHRRISNLQSKAIFFQGQVDPLHTQNINLKEQLIALTKIVIASTQLLRNLLPTNDHPSKKLRLQMANLTEISDMIKHDWLEMQQTLARNTQMIATLEKERNQWHLKFDEQYTLRIGQINQMESSRQKMKSEFENSIIGLKYQINHLIEEQKIQKQNMNADFRKRLSIYDSALKQYELFKYQTKLKQKDYQKAIQRLKGQILANYQSFEQGKKNLKQIYDKIMSEKLAEQAQGYEMMLKIREDEKIAMMIQMGQIQQEHKRKFALKEYQIAKLNELTTTFKEQIGQLKSQVWSKQICIDKHQAEIKNLEQQIVKANKENTALQKSIEDQAEIYKLQKISLEQKIKKQKIQMEAIKRDGGNALKKILEQRQKLQKQLEETNEKNKQLSSSLSKVQAQFNAKIAKLTQNWQKEAEDLKLQIEKGKKQLDEVNDALKVSQFQKENLIREHDQSVKLLKKIFQKKQEQLISDYEKKIATLQFDSQQTLKQIKRKHEQILREANIAANEELRQVMMDCNRKLTIQAQQMHKQMEAYRKEGAEMRNLLAKAQQQILNKQKQVERIRYEHNKELEKIHEQNELEKQKLNDELDKQIKQFQRSLEEKEAELSNMRADMQNQIKMLKQANSIDTIEQRYQLQMNKLKEQFQDKFKQMESQFKDRFDQLQENKKKQIEILAKKHQQQMENQNKLHQNDLTQIAEKTQHDVTFLNDRIINGLSDFNLENLTAEQKRQYIINKVSDLKNITAEKEIEIVKLQNSLADMQRNIQKRIKARREELELEKEQVVRNCQKRVDQLQSECSSKVLAAESERIKHTQIMYSEFEILRQQHIYDRQSLLKKYNELQKLFEERPSRAEDLTKIKELINMQTKMDIEIQSYQKKMETANQIVKYLNLQLENYKDTYDIFGPNADNKEGGLVGLALRLKEQLSSHPIHNQNQSIIDVIKARKHQRYHSEGKLNSDKSVTKEASFFQKWVDSPPIKEIKLFAQEESRFVTPQSENKNGQFLRYSNLMQQKSIERKQKFKTERSEHLDNEAEILSNAQHFIRLIKQNKTQNPVIKQEDQFSRRKSYRKRKLGRKRPTVGVQNYF